MVVLKLEAKVSVTVIVAVETWEMPEVLESGEEACWLSFSAVDVPGSPVGWGQTDSVTVMVISPSELNISGLFLVLVMPGLEP